MKVLDDFSNIFKRYDLDLEKTGEARKVSKDATMQEIAQFVVDGDDEGILPAVKKALESKSPIDVINDALIAGMNEVSRLWDEGVYFLPQVILSSDAMNVGIAECEAKMGKSMDRKSTVVTHTAEGDIHDIGKGIIVTMLRVHGYDVHDIGRDVPIDTFVEKARELNADVVGSSAMMTWSAVLNEGEKSSVCLPPHSLKSRDWPSMSGSVNDT